MAKARKLKVFRTPIGFHDAYVAAPSQKAALEAWGSASNLFASGAAEQVTDPALTDEPLANPGMVIRRLRGSETEQLEALGKKNVEKARRKAPKSKAAAPSPPKPGREEVEAAKRALAEAERRHSDERESIDKKIAVLEREKRQLQRRHESERDSLAEEIERAAAAHMRAMRQWEKARTQR